MLATSTIVFVSTTLVSRLLAPVVSDGWKKITKAEEKEEKKRLKHFQDDIASKLELQRSSHEERLNEARKNHEDSMKRWATDVYYKNCWPLRNPFEMQICEPISEDKSFFGENIIVPCRLISALKDSDHPYARTINGNMSSFIVNYYPANSIHAVVSEIGAWKDDVPNNDASVNYLYAGLKKQPVMVIAPTLIDDGKTFIFKVWSWGLGEDLNYPAGFELGRLYIKPLYSHAIYEETLKMIQLGKELGQESKFFSPKLRHNISVINEMQNKKLSKSAMEMMLSFLSSSPEIDDAVKSSVESTISGIFCCMAGMYADAYHLLEYKTLPKLPSLLPKIPGVQFMIPALKEYYYTLLSNLELIESDKTLLSQLYFDIADSFSKLPFTFENQEEIILPFTNRAVCHFIQGQDEKYCSEKKYVERLNDPSSLKTIVALNYTNAQFVKDVNVVLKRVNLDSYE